MNKLLVSSRLRLVAVFVAMSVSGFSLAQVPPNFSIGILPSSPVAFDSVVARIGALNGCSIDESTIRIAQANNAIRVDVGSLSTCVPTGGISFDVLLGKLPTGSYSVTVYQPANVAVATAQFDVAEKYGANPPSHPLMDYTDHWWNPQESGWGMSIMQHPSDRLFAVWYVYDQNRQPTWYTLQPGSWLASNTYAGPVYKTTGPYFGGTFDPATVGIAQVGTATLKFSNQGTGEFTYSVEGVSGKKAISRMPF